MPAFIAAAGAALANKGVEMIRERREENNQIPEHDFGTPQHPRQPERKRGLVKTVAIVGGGALALYGASKITGIGLDIDMPAVYENRTVIDDPEVLAMRIEAEALGCFASQKSKVHIDLHDEINIFGRTVSDDHTQGDIVGEYYLCSNLGQSNVEVDPGDAITEPSVTVTLTEFTVIGGLNENESSIGTDESFIHDNTALDGRVSMPHKIVRSLAGVIMTDFTCNQDVVSVAQASAQDYYEGIIPGLSQGQISPNNIFVEFDMSPQTNDKYPEGRAENDDLEHMINRRITEPEDKIEIDGNMKIDVGATECAEVYIDSSGNVVPSNQLTTGIPA